MTVCGLCGREVNKLTKHHLIPRTRHKNKKNKRTFTRQEVKERVAYFCRSCHSHVHAIFTEKELENKYNTIAEISEHPEIRKFVSWIKEKPAHFKVRAKRKK